MFQIGLKKFCRFKKLKTLCRGNNVISDLNSENFFGMFYQKEWQKTIQKEFRLEKVIERKGDKLYV